MKNIITYENLHYFAYSNDKLCRGKVKGIVLDFFGLGAQLMYDDHPWGRELALQNIILVIPYNNPWAWMNRQAVDYTDEIIDVLFAHYGINDLPIVASGGSMGGLSALVYSAYARRTPVRCVASCPVCDLPYHYTERPDLPRTLYSAFFSCADMDSALRSASPLHLAMDGRMPDIDYFIFHCSRDSAVNINAHSEKLVNILRHNRRVKYAIVMDRDHCDLTEQALCEYRKSITDAFCH